MIAATTDPDSLWQALLERRPQAALLAVLTCLPVRVTPALLRLARLRLLPHADTGDEADLWLSELVDAKSGGGFTYRREVRDYLRRRLAEDASRLDAVWHHVHREHAPWLSARASLEEELTWRLLRQPADPWIERQWLTTIDELDRDPNAHGIARWLIRAMNDLPPHARDDEAGARAFLGARLLLGDASMLDERPQVFVEASRFAFATRRLPRRTLHVARIRHGVLISPDAPIENGFEFEVPVTRPIWIQVEPRGDVTLTPRVLRISGAEPVSCVIGSDTLTLRLIDGSSYELGPPEHETVVPAVRSPEGVFRFEGWELNAVERTLSIDGQPMRIGTRAFDVLLALITARPSAVSKGNLLEAAWPGLVAEENNISVQIASLRKLLGTSAIATVPGVGYRLAAVSLPTMVASPPIESFEASAPKLIGYAADLKRVGDLVADGPLTSLIGSGGVGKTTLARALYAAQKGRWPDGEYWIDLATTSPGTPLLPIVATALEMRAAQASERQEFLLEVLAPLNALIVLDSCDHLMAEVSECLAPSLRHAPGLHWLVIGQQPLDLEAENVHRLRPLAVPDDGASMATLATNPAIELLRTRILAADPGFKMADDQLESMAAICRRLDGLPLAIELAAPRIAQLGFQAVQQGLDSALRSVETRQRTLRSALEWSHDLLSPVEQRLLRRLEPFVSGFTTGMALGLAERMAVGEGPLMVQGELIDSLQGLVDKSLVERMPPDRGARSRLQLSELVRDFARDRLTDAGEFERVQQAHAETLADAFAPAHLELQGGRETDWVAKYMPERRNVLVALDWACRAGQPDLLARLVAALGLLEGIEATPRELALLPVPLDLLAQAEPAFRAPALSELGWSHFRADDLKVAEDLLALALVPFQDIGHTAGLYVVAMRLATIMFRQSFRQSEAEAYLALANAPDADIPLRDRLLCGATVDRLRNRDGDVARLQDLSRVAERAGFDSVVAQCQVTIAEALAMQGRFVEVLDLASRASTALAVGGDSRAAIDYVAAVAMLRLGRFDQALEAAKALSRTGPVGAREALELMAHAALSSNQVEEAALLMGQSDRAAPTTPVWPHSIGTALRTETLERLRAALGSPRLADLMAAGAAAKPSDLMDLATQPRSAAAAHGIIGT